MSSKTSKNKKILLITEGTYPFNFGGVSSWCHTLCNNVKNVEYSIYSFNAQFEYEPKYEINKNIKKIVQVPIWELYPLTDILNYGTSYMTIITKKSNTNNYNIRNYFLKPFSQFVSNLISTNQDLNLLEKSIYELNSYFERYDFDSTLTHIVVWEEFKNILHKNHEDNSSELIIKDTAFAFNYINKLMVCLALPVPEVDIAHLTIAGLAILPALIAKKKYNTKIITTEHGVFIRENMINISSTDLSMLIKNIIIRCSESLSRLAYKKSDIVTSVNRFNTNWEFNYGLDKDKSKIIYNGVDVEKFNIGEKPTNSKSKHTVVAIARIFGLKDIFTMIKTCSEVKKEISEIQFIVYGDKKSDIPYVEECEKLINSLDLSDNFCLAGHHSQPNKAFLEGDISILTSISEGFPYTVIESMSCGIPVVATDVGGVAEAITKQTGFVCKPKDYKSLAKKVILLLKDNELRKKMGSASRKRVLENFKLEDIITIYENTYDEVLACEQILEKA